MFVCLSVTKSLYLWPIDDDCDDDDPSSDCRDMSLWSRCASVISNWILCSGENRAAAVSFETRSHSILTLKMSQDDGRRSILLTH